MENHVFNFIQGKSYFCIVENKRSNQIMFEVGQLYKCVEILDEDRYSSEYKNDWSKVKFVSDTGKVITFFGSVANIHFCTETKYIKNHLNQRISQLKSEIYRYDKEMSELQYTQNRLEEKILEREEEIEFLKNKRSNLIDLNKK